MSYQLKHVTTNIEAQNLFPRLFKLNLAKQQLKLMLIVMQCTFLRTRLFVHKFQNVSAFVSRFSPAFCLSFLKDFLWILWFRTWFSVYTIELCWHKSCRRRAEAVLTFVGLDTSMLIVKVCSNFHSDRVRRSLLNSAVNLLDT